MIDEKTMKAWAADLCSGQYASHCGALRHLTQDRFDPLGVLLDLLVPDGWDERGHHLYSAGRHSIDTDVLPSSYQQEITRLYDEEHASFEEIATFIRETYPSLLAHHQALEQAFDRMRAA